MKTNMNKLLSLRFKNKYIEYDNKECCHHYSYNLSGNSNGENPSETFLTQEHIIKYGKNYSISAIIDKTSDISGYGSYFLLYEYENELSLSRGYFKLADYESITYV